MRRLLLILIFPVVVFAQTFEDNVTVSYVEVPVTVIGRDGVPVRGLTKANFEIRDEGVKREIESFEAVDFSRADVTKTVSPLAAASRRNFLLLFDLSYSKPQSVLRAQDAARDFIARSMGGRDLVSVGVVDVDRGFRFLTAFTSDRELLAAAIADPKNFRSADPLQLVGIGLLQTEPQTAGEVGDRGAIALENLRDVARMAGRMDDAYNRARVTRQVGMLADIARVLSRLAGRKHLVLLSDGFDPRLVSGREVGSSPEKVEEDAAVERGETWKIDSDKRFGNSQSQKSIRMMADQFRRADVILHAVDIHGLRVGNDVRSGAAFNSNEGLFLLANSTGGTVFRNSNDISAQFDKLSRQHEVVYVLGFRAPAGGAGQFHELRVRLANVPGAQVQHRGGYYDDGAESGIARTLSLAEIIINDIPQRDIAFDTMAAAFPGADDKGQVPVVLEIDGTSLIGQAKNGRATADVFIYAFDEAGIVRDAVHQRMTLELAQLADRLRSSGVRFYGTLDLLPGRYVLKTLIRVLETDRRGFSRTELNVPRSGDVAVTRPLFFAEAGDWIMIKAASDDPAAPYPFVLGTEPFIPSASATLRRGEPRLFTVFVYNAALEELTWETAPAATLVSEESRTGLTKLVFALERVGPGVKELTVTVRRKDSTDARTVTTPIEVQ